MIEWVIYMDESGERAIGENEIYKYDYFVIKDGFDSFDEAMKFLQAMPIK